MVFDGLYMCMAHLTHIVTAVITLMILNRQSTSERFPFVKHAGLQLCANFCTRSKAASAASEALEQPPQPGIAELMARTCDLVKQKDMNKHRHGLRLEQSLAFSQNAPQAVSSNRMGQET